MNKQGRWIKYLPVTAMLAIIVLFGTTLRNTSVEDILSFAPDSYVLSALVVLGLYALKSVSVVFPLLVLYVSVGAIFPAPIALLVNAAGLLVCITLPYLIGRFSGRDLVSRLTTRYPKAGKLADYTSRNALYTSYLLRIINLLPGDVVSMILGASGMAYPSYMVGSLLGLLPIMVPASLAGQSLKNPLSAAFLVPFGVTIVLSIGSTWIYNRMQKRHSRSAPSDSQP